MKTFAERIKALRAEVEALKAVKSKSSTTLATITKTITCTAVKQRDDPTPLGPGMIFTKYMALIEIIPTDPANPLIFSYSQPPYAERGNRSSLCYGWMMANGNPAVLVNPGSSSSDNDMAAQEQRTITLTIYITATGDFTTNVTQVLAE